ncbi:MAG: glycosyltransferase family 2 protein [Deltaproteobacteria bacterium]|nr:glycosyltransferase family 2 protein [Deltaproteobacteria bacterium]
MDITVILPVFNERDNIRPLLSEIEQALAPIHRSYEIIAVDDGSRDGSAQLLEELAREKPNLNVVFLRQNFGQAAAFDAGFRHASGRIIVTMDSDLQNDPLDIPKMIRVLEEGSDFVSGWRKKRQDGFFLRTVPSRVANWLIRLVTKTKVHDLGCSLKVYRREITDELKLYGEMHRFIAVLVESFGARVAEVEVNHRPRHAGVSKYGILRTFKVLLDLITVWFMRGYNTKPIYLFGGAGVAMLGFSVLSSAYVLYEKFHNDVWVHKNPLFIISMIFGLVGVQFIGMGIIAELIIRTYYESQYKSSYSISRTLGFATRKCVEL